MGWAVEQNTGINDRVIRCVWFQGYIYAFTRNAGVWRRDGVGPWVQVFAGGGIGWYWPDDDAFYCTGGAAFGGNQIYRSTDGVTWTLDVDLNVAFGLQVAYSQWAAIGGYGPWLLVANWDGAGGPWQTHFYRRNLAGTWAVFGAPHVGQDGQEQKGIIQWGARVFWTTDLGAGGEVRYWDGAAWTADATIDGLCGYPSHMNVIGNTLYIGASYLYSPPGGYYWRTSGMTVWRFLPHEIPNTNWNVTSLCRGADGEDYTVSRNGAGTGLRVYRRVGNALSLVGSEPGSAVGDTYIGVCVDAAGDMYFGTASAGPQISFYAFVGVYNLTPGGLYPQAMDCDGDGDMLYLALYDTATAQPILVSVALPLDGAASMGNAMFNPGAGTRINVRCNSVGDSVAIGGHFGANEQVETSDDGGITWTDIDPGTWGAALAEPLAVDPVTLDEVMIALTPQSIIETVDGGTTWTTLNAAVGFSPGAMVKLVNGDEMVIGDDAANVILYSPNRGVTTAVVTGAFGGFVAALEIT